MIETREIRGRSVRRGNGKTAIAGLHPARLAAGVEDAARLIDKVFGNMGRFPDAVNAPGRLTGADRASEFVERLEDSLWLPPAMITVGPVPLAMTAMGTLVTPQASSLGEWGNMMWPSCFPMRPKSMRVKAGERRGVIDLRHVGLPESESPVARSRSSPRSSARRSGPVSTGSTKQRVKVIRPPLPRMGAAMHQVKR